jgi:hypothetical protein
MIVKILTDKIMEDGNQEIIGHAPCNVKVGEGTWIYYHRFESVRKTYGKIIEIINT